jgi:hypothetical protein
LLDSPQHRASPNLGQNDRAGAVRRGFPQDEMIAVEQAVAGKRVAVYSESPARTRTSGVASACR